jgi:hypothetical protein
LAQQYLLQKAHNEEAKLDPWTTLAIYRLKAEDEVKRVDGYVFLFLSTTSYVRLPENETFVAHKGVVVTAGFLGSFSDPLLFMDLEI